MPREGIGETLLSKFLASIIERFGDAVGIYGESIASIASGQFALSDFAGPAL